MITNLETLTTLKSQNDSEDKVEKDGEEDMDGFSIDGDEEEDEEDKDEDEEFKDEEGYLE